MKMFTLSLIAALMAACGRAPDAHGNTPPGAQPGESGSHPKVTLVGCLQDVAQPTGVPTGTTGAASGSAGGASDQKAAGAGSPGERFTLTDARSESAASNPRGGSYVLDGNLEALRTHVNQQVRVSGELDATAANTAGPQRIRVMTVESAGGSCTR
jgi:hypothetical protein